MPTPYQVALATRGSGAFSYTYLGPPDLGPGQLVAVRFRSRVELGLLVGLDETPPVGIDLQALAPVASDPAGWGQLLLQLCELSCAAPYELASRLALSGSLSGLRWELHLLDYAGIDPAARVALDQCSGNLTPAKRRTLAVEKTWACLLSNAQDGHVALRVGFAGQPGVSSARANLRCWLRLDAPQRNLLGLGHHLEEWWPQRYLAGLTGQPDLAQLERRKEAPVLRAPLPSTPATVAWDDLAWPREWDLLQHWPAIATLLVRRWQCTWPDLRERATAELSAWIAAGERVLLLAPQAWLLDRLWPALAGIAPWLQRYSATDPPGTLAGLLHWLTDRGQPGGRVVAGTESVWKLPAYTYFDRVVLIDPSHPQWRPENAPWLDPRTALLLAAARHGPRLDLIEFGQSAFDGRQAAALHIHAPHLPATEPGVDRQAPADTNPLPLGLRQPGVRRLVYFNRLGASRGLRCVECDAAVPCPACGSQGLHYSARSKRYTCAQCGVATADLRCPRCGLGTFSVRLPGLEAVRTRAGEAIVQQGQLRPGPEVHTVIGTSQLLEPLDFWPEEVVYIDPDERDLLGRDVRTALDMGARLAALYANPRLAGTHVVSTRLAGAEPHASVPPTRAAELHRQEAGLAQLAGLPPYGCLYRLRAIAGSLAPLRQLRAFLGLRLAEHPQTTLLKLSQPFNLGRRVELRGYLQNAGLSWAELQQLRWESRLPEVFVGCAALRGPWL